MAFKIGNTSIKRIFLGQVEKHFVWKGVQLVYKSITQFVTEYVSRVSADGGTTEATDNVNNLMQDLRNKDLFEDATFVLVPSGTKTQKVYSEIPQNANGDLTFTRASTATFVNEQGLIESSPRNLLQRSEEFDNGIWSKTGSTILPNVGLSVTNTLTADKFIPNNGTNQIRIGQSTSVIGGIKYTYSIYAKKAGFRYLTIFADSSNIQEGAFFGSTRYIDLDNGNVSSAIYTTENMGNDWYKIMFSFTPTVDIASFRVAISIQNTTSINVNSVVGNGVDGCLLWGAQLEIGSTVTPYIATTDRLNHPRIDYSTGKPTLLLEPQRTNLLLRSEEFDSTSWTKVVATVTPNVAISPDGNLTADLVSDTGSFHNISLATTVLNSTMYTLSVYVKPNTSTQATLRLSSGVFDDRVAYTFADLTTTVIVSSAGYIGSSIVSVSNGWYRLILTTTSNSTTLTTILYPDLITNESPNSCYFSGAQLEQGSFQTSYIPTTTTTVTRLADSFTRNNVFTNGLISSQGGTWFVELVNNVPLVRDAAAFGIFLDNSSTGNVDGFAIRSGSASSVRLAIVKRISSVITTLHTLSVGSKLVVKWNGTTADVFDNGLKVVSNSSFTNTSMQFLGSQIVDAPRYIKQMALYNKPLSDAECIKLTTI